MLFILQHKTIKTTCLQRCECMHNYNNKSLDKFHQSTVPNTICVNTSTNCKHTYGKQLVMFICGYYIQKLLTFEPPYAYCCLVSATSTMFILTISLSSVLLEVGTVSTRIWYDRFLQSEKVEKWWIVSKNTSYGDSPECVAVPEEQR